MRPSHGSLPYRWSSALAAALALAILPATAMALADGEEPAAPPQVNPIDNDAFTPTIVTTIEASDGATPDDEVQARVLEALTRSLQRGMLSSVATDVYAAGKKFPKSTTRRGPVSGVMRTMGYMDAYFDEAMRTDLKEKLERNDKKWRFTVQGFLAKGITGRASIEDQAVPPNLTMLWQVTKSTILETLDANTADTINRATATPVLSCAPNDPRLLTMLAQGPELYESLATEENKFRFIPMYFKFWIDIDGPQVGVGFTSTIKPGEFAIRSGFATDQPIRPTAVSMAPSLAPAGRHPLMQITMQRNWGSNVTLPAPVAIITFGDMVDKDISQVDQCIPAATAVPEFEMRSGEDTGRKDCTPLLRALPSIQAKFQAAALIPDAEAKTPKYWPKFIAKLREGRTGQAVVAFVKRLAEKFDAAQQKYTTMNIMLSQLTIDFTNPAGPTILPEVSNTPVVLQVVTGVNVAEAPIRDKFIVLSRVASPKDAKDFDGDRDGIVGARKTWAESFAESMSITGRLKALIFKFTRDKIRMLQAGVLLPLYNKTVGPTVAANLSGELRNKASSGLSDIDSAANQHVGNLVSPLVNLLK
jgi:hypothetical protein